MNYIAIVFAAVVGFLASCLYSSRKNAKDNIVPPPIPAPTQWEGESNRAFAKRYLMYLSQNSKTR